MIGTESSDACWELVSDEYSPVKRRCFGAEQIVAVLKQAKVGVPVVEVCRQVGISEQTFYRWNTQYLGKRPVLTVC